MSLEASYYVIVAGTGLVGTVSTLYAAKSRLFQQKDNEIKKIMKSKK